MDLSIINQHPRRQKGPCLLHQMVHAPCESLAVDYFDEASHSTLSYDALHRASEHLAKTITAALGGTTEHFIAPLLIEQSSMLYVSQLAILKAGGAFCPINIDSPVDRIRFIVKDVSAKVILVSEKLQRLLPKDEKIHTIIVKYELVDTVSMSENYSRRTPAAEDLAYVMYTSGSTGTPKGVGISHDAATQALLAHETHIPQFHRFLQFAAPTFDVSIFEIFFPLFRGSTIVAVRRERMLDNLPKVIRELNVDACELTPSVAGSLLRRREDVPDLKLLLTIGEMLSVPVVEEFGSHDSLRSVLWAMYGPTEATIHCTLQVAAASDSSVSDIGVPLDTVSCFIIEPSNSKSHSVDVRVMPLGEAGELAIGGYQLATGYINQPDQTAKAFISSEYGRLYRTGDQARMLPNGHLEFVGRLADGQVKLRGQRMELGEVESTVLKEIGCHGAFGAIIDEVLVLFCAVDHGVTEEHLLTICRTWLPSFMIPGEFVIMKEFPLLPSGKIDRKSLKLMHQSNRIHRVSEYRLNPLQNGGEAEIIVLISGLMKRQITPNMSLSLAGIDSLKAIQLSSVFRSAGWEIAVHHILAGKTIKDLFTRIRKLRLSPGITAPNISLLANLPDILNENENLKAVSQEIVEILPCTWLQNAMLAETFSTPGAYCNTIEIAHGSGIVQEKVFQAIKKICQKNEIFRSVFASTSQGFCSIILKGLPKGSIRLIADITNDTTFEEPEQTFLNPFRVENF